MKTCPVYSFNSLILLLPPPPAPPPPVSVLCYLEDSFHISAICLRKAWDLQAVADLGQRELSSGGEAALCNRDNYADMELLKQLRLEIVLPPRLPSFLERLQNI